MRIKVSGKMKKLSKKFHDTELTHEKQVTTNNTYTSYILISVSLAKPHQMSVKLGTTEGARNTGYSSLRRICQRSTLSQVLETDI